MGSPALIYSKFRNDNMHLTMAAHNNKEGVFENVVKALGRSLSELKTDLASLRLELAQRPLAAPIKASPSKSPVNQVAQRQAASISSLLTRSRI